MPPRILMLGALALSMGCVDEEGNADNGANAPGQGKANDGASSDPTFENICATITDKAEAEEGWSSHPHAADCPAELLKEAEGWASEKGVEASSFLPGLMGCVQHSASSSDFESCAVEVYQGAPAPDTTE